jgi:hypothetical protein
MSAKTQRIIGWVLSGLITAFLIGGSAAPKLFLADTPDMAERLGEMGFTTDVMKKIGIVEAIVAVLYVIPRTGFLGAILVTGYLGGAIATHVRVQDIKFIMPIVMGVLVWVALGLRQPGVFRLAAGKD